MNPFSMDTQQALYQRIRARGFRLTPQRQVILNIVTAGGGHLTIEQVYQKARAQAPALNLVTVYRTLNFFCELRLMVAADIGGGRKVYEMAGERPHHHLICRTCGKVERIEQEEVQAVVERMDAVHQFLIDMDHMAFFGLCSTCRTRK
jgi:Fur family ferric uptake transcriptional regulator